MTHIHQASWLQRCGAAVFVLFFLKGVAWIAAAGVMWYWAGQ